MFFTNASWMMGGVMSLEGLRRSQTGGTALAVFIAIEADAPFTAWPLLDFMGTLKDVALSIIDHLPPFLQFAASPFTDYCIATGAFIDCIRSKIETEIPDPSETSCTLYWD